MTARPRSRWLALAAAGLLLPSTLLLGGCNDAQAGSLFGAGIGALAGNAIGGDTEGTLIGTGIGAVAGYVIGNESDKERSNYYRGSNVDYGSYGSGGYDSGGYSEFNFGYGYGGGYGGYRGGHRGGYARGYGCDRY